MACKHESVQKQSIVYRCTTTENQPELGSELEKVIIWVIIYHILESKYT
jgi:hypothetical protein